MGHNTGMLAIGAVLLAAFTAAAGQVITTYNEYEQMPNGYPFGYPGYLTVETIRDASSAAQWAMRNGTHYGMTYGVNPARRMMGNEVLPVAKHMNDVIPLCVPDSLANQGWYNPQPGSTMDAYRRAAENFTWNIARDRIVPGSDTNSGLYKNENIAVFARSGIGNWSRDHRTPAADVRIVDGPLSEACKIPGYSGREGYTVSGQPKRAPLAP